MAPPGESDDLFVGFAASSSASSPRTASPSPALPAASAPSPGLAGLMAMRVPFTPAAGASAPALSGVSGGSSVSPSTLGASPSVSVTTTRSHPKCALVEITQVWLDSVCCGAIGNGGQACCQAKPPGESNCGTSHQTKNMAWTPEVGDLTIAVMKSNAPYRMLTDFLMKKGVELVPASVLITWKDLVTDSMTWSSFFRSHAPTSVMDGSAPARPPMQSVRNLLQTPSRSEDVANYKVESPFTLSEEMQRDYEDNDLNAPVSLAFGRVAEMGAELAEQTSVQLHALSVELAGDTKLMGRHLDDMTKALGTPTQRMTAAGGDLCEVVDRILLSSEERDAAELSGEVCTQAAEAKALADEARTAADTTRAMLESVKPGLLLARDLARGGITARDITHGCTAGTTAMIEQGKAAVIIKAYLEEFRKSVTAQVNSITDEVAKLARQAGSSSTWAAFATEHEVVEPEVPGASLLAELQDALARVRTCELKISQMQAKQDQASGEGIHMGRFHFNSFDDVYDWVLKNLQEDDFAFGMFLDCISVCELMVDSRRDSDSVAKHINAASNAGFKDLNEAKALASFRPGLPTMFDGPGELPLPKLNKPALWDNPSSYTTGMKERINKFMKTELEKTLEVQIAKLKNVEARELAGMMRMRTVEWWHDFSENLTLTHTGLTVSAGMGATESWEFTTNEARRILVEVNLVRSVAQDLGARLKDQRAVVCSTVLLAMLRCHKMMQSFKTHDFKDHPSIGAERIKLLFNNLAVQNSGSGNHAATIAALKTKVEAATKAASNAQSKADSLDAKLKDLAKAVEKKKDK